MTAVDLIHARLAANAPLVALMSGGVVNYVSLKGKGVSRSSFPSAYVQVAGKPTKLKPLLVVKGRALIPTNLLRDPTAQTTTTRQIVELWFYADQDAGWGTLETAAALAYTLLQDRPVTGTFNLSLTNEVTNEREPSMDDACFIRTDYEVIGRK